MTSLIHQVCYLLDNLSIQSRLVSIKELQNDIKGRKNKLSHFYIRFYIYNSINIIPPTHARINCYTSQMIFFVNKYVYRDQLNLPFSSVYPQWWLILFLKIFGFEVLFLDCCWVVALAVTGTRLNKVRFVTEGYIRKMPGNRD